MDLHLLNYINVDMNWTVLRKGRTTMTRCPRKSIAHIFESAGVERKKKRKLAHRSTSLSPQTLCINGEVGPSPGPQTPSVQFEDSGQRFRANSLSHSVKRKSKARLRNSKVLKRTNKKVIGLDDFSGIELLAAVACSRLIHDNADRVEEFSVSKEHTTPPGISLCSVDVKDAESNGSSIGKEVDEKKVVVSKELRLHWDLNTVMDEWKEPCDDLLIERRLSVKDDAAISLAPLTENCNDGLIEDLEVMSTKKISIKTSDGESSASKSDVVDDSLTHPGKCEDFSSSTTSVKMEQTVVNCKAERIDDPLVHSYSKDVAHESDQHPVSEEAMQGFCYNNIATDHVTECCGSNVTQEEQGHMAEGYSEDKLQAGYDSPFEDGELRELIGKTEKETVHESSNKIYKDDLGTIEHPLSEKADHGHTTGDQTSLLGTESVSNDEIKLGVQVDAFERPYSDKSRKYYFEKKDGNDNVISLVGGNLLQKPFDASRNGEYVQRNRSSTSGDFSLRVWDLKSHRSLDSNYSRNYNSRGGGYRAYDRRPSPSERNDGHGCYRGPPPARSHSRDRYRFHTQEYRDPKPCYLERKRFSPNFNQHGVRSRPRSRSRSRSRSQSPIAWHFQKRKNIETSNSVEDETVSRSGHVSPERSSKCFDDRRFRDGRFRENRQSSFTIKQRFDPLGYPERLKSNDYYRRPARFQQMTGYKYNDKQ
ncbi:hypothetical protein M8C21_021809 [Ambrosia artemisiifolia]|uniref:Uncharacterized protein n=1 Tax=Ambrosia artemisiifolia TaxID=4212 RepID=A0AAD5BQI6_AMBAR|nr:hypothetical protein M8C21_021809 [Ambrosia artemisiifolia]